MHADDFQTAAIYVNEAQARLALEGLLDLSLSHPEIEMFEPMQAEANEESVNMQRTVFRQHIKAILPDTVTGAALGTGVSGLGSLLLAAHGPALFISLPILTGLSLTGGGAALGGVLGAGIALKIRHDSLDTAIDAARRCGHWVIRVMTHSKIDHQAVLDFLAGWPEVEVKEG